MQPDIEDLKKKVAAWGDVPEKPEIPDIEIERHVHNH
jgi:hypothetical protein